MKILIFSTVYYPYHIGGAEISTQLLAEGLVKEKNIEVHILTHGIKDEEEDVNGVKVIRKNFGIGTKEIFNVLNKDNNISIIKKILSKSTDFIYNKNIYDYYKKLFDTEKYDAIITSGNSANLGKYNLWKSAKKVNIPIIHIIRDPNLLFMKDARENKIKLLDKIYRKMSKRGLKYVDYIVGITQYMIDKHTKMGYKFKNTKIIPNAVEFDKLAQKVNFENKKNIILYVGAISKNKGVHTLIKAFNELNLTEYELHLIGEKRDVQVEESDKIIYHGRKNMEETYEFMAESKFLVLPSEWEEAFGRVIIEAVFNGTIAIGSDRGGIPEVYGQNNKEYIFNSGNVESLKEKILFLTNLDKNEYEKRLKDITDDFKKYTSKEHINIWYNYLSSIINNK